MTTAKLNDTRLDGACYIKGENGTHFPPDFQPEQFKMVAIDRENSDPKSKDKFQACAGF